MPEKITPGPHHVLILHNGRKMVVTEGNTPVCTPECIEDAMLHSAAWDLLVEAEKRREVIRCGSKCQCPNCRAINKAKGNV